MASKLIRLGSVEELIRSSVVLVSIIHVSTIRTPQHKLTNARIECVTTAISAIWFACIGKLAFVINAHKVECSASDFISMMLKSIKDCPNLSMRAASLIVFWLNGKIELVYLFAHTIGFIIQSRTVVTASDNFAILDNNRAASRTMTDSVLSDYCRSLKKWSYCAQLIPSNSAHSLIIKQMRAYGTG